jgi:hypothetical protein
VLWDFETATEFIFPWARKLLRIIKGITFAHLHLGVEVSVFWYLLAVSDFLSALVPACSIRDREESMDCVIPIPHSADLLYLIGCKNKTDPPIGPPKAGDKLKILDKASGSTLVELEIPPAPLVNAKSLPHVLPTKPVLSLSAFQSHRIGADIMFDACVFSSARKGLSSSSPAGPNNEVRPPSPGPAGPPGSGGLEVEFSEAVARLKEFTSSKGWYDLQRRLLDAGHTDYRAYAQVRLSLISLFSMSPFGWACTRSLHQKSSCPPSLSWISLADCNLLYRLSRKWWLWPDRPTCSNLKEESYI